MNKITNEEFIIELFNTKHNFKYDYSKIDYKGLRKQIVVICPTHGEFSINAGNHKNGNGCSKCNIDNQRMSKEEFINRSNKIHNSKYNYDSVIYKNNHSKIRINCHIHGEYEQTPQDHLSGNGCSKCWAEKELNNRILYKNIWIKKCNIFHNNIYDYSKSNYHNNEKEVIIICPIHGEFYQKPRTHLTHGCKICSESKGEKQISIKLDKINIKYIREYKFKNCIYIKELPFDFYLPDNRICIEFNGEQHYKSIDHFGGDKRLIQQVKKDNIKKQFCIENNIKLIEIRYDEDINEKLEHLYEKTY